MVKRILTDYSILSGLHQGKSCVIVGGSKNIDMFPYSDFKGVVISMGDVPIRGVNLFRTDYWVTANCYWPRPWNSRDADAINFASPKMFFLSTATFPLLKPEHIEYSFENSIKNIDCDVFFYDQRHFKNKCCFEEKGCCKVFKKLSIKETIQEFIAGKYNNSKFYSSGSTVALHAFALAIIMECNPIYIIGVDIPQKEADYTYYEPNDIEYLLQKFGSMGPYDLSFDLVQNTSNLNYSRYLGRFLPKFLVNNLKIWKNAFNKSVFNKSVFFPDLPQILFDFSYLAELANKSGLEVINLNPNSTLVKVKGIKTMNINKLII